MTATNVGALVVMALGNDKDRDDDSLALALEEELHIPLGLFCTKRDGLPGIDRNPPALGPVCQPM